MSVLERFHPFVRDWFASRFVAPTPAQVDGWPAIAEGRDTLVAAPTGSGKTLAAFLWSLDGLVRQGLGAGLPAGTEVVYVSPLKALGNDVERNLQVPLQGIRDVAARAGVTLPDVRVAVRSGDTPSAARAKMVRERPHILITTPESLYILLTSEKGREMLGGVRTVIVDEIHAVAASKRGAHLALTLERLDALVKSHGHAAPVRVGLSATQRPIERIARLLVGNGRPLPTLVDRGHLRDLDLRVEIPADEELSAVASGEQMQQIYDRVAELARAHRTTLVFANTRKLTERVAFNLQQRLGEDKVAAHHGALAREIRLSAEQRLKHGELSCLVATASLELGIDIGDVDLVVQIGSPRSIATFLQRIGRAGHAVGATPKGRIFAQTRDQLGECAALMRAVREGRLDLIPALPGPLDILSQQIVATTAGEAWSEDDLFAMARRAAPYADLERRQFDQVLEMLSEGIATDRGRTGAHLHRDQVNGVVRGRRGARLAAITSGGAIPERADYAVILDPEEIQIGTLDEDFAVESMAGDVFLLGSNTWKIRRVEPGRVRVEPAPGQSPGVPFWLGEAPPRTPELSAEVGRLRADVAAQIDAGATLADVAGWVERTCLVEPDAAGQLVAYLAATKGVLGALPTHDTVVAERFFDEGGGMQLVIHAPLGGRLNRAWGLALRKRFCVTFDFELQAAATDDGLVLSLGPTHSFPLETVFDFLSPNTVEKVLEQAILTHPIFGGRWRWNAQRSLAVLRFQGGRRVPPPLLRMKTDDLLATVFPQQVACFENITGPLEPPDHPLVFETLRDCLTEYADLAGLKDLVRRIQSGEIRTVSVESSEPSPLSHEILNANPYAFLDDAPLEERRTRAVVLRRGLPDALAGGLGALDAEAIRTVAEQVAPDARDPDEVHDALLTLGLLPEPVPEGFAPWLEVLARDGRATRAPGHGWVAAERVALVSAAIPGVRFSPAIPGVGGFDGDAHAARVALVRGHLECAALVTASGLAQRLGLHVDDVEAALLALESTGLAIRGRFSGETDEKEWADRRVLARIHRLTLGRLRREIDPVTPADFMRALLEWHHVRPETRLHGVGGVARAVEALQGFEVPAAAWERDLLPSRVARYEPGWLDQLCLSGVVAWGRLFPRAVAAGSSPTRVAPIAFVRRDALDDFLGAADNAAVEHLGAAARDVLDHLERRGASFPNEIQVATRRLPGEVEDALWALVSAGLVTADGFGALRSLMVRGKVSKRPKKARAPWWARGVAAPAPGGRWSILRREGVGDAPDAEKAARQLLNRYGVIFRDLLAREAWAPRWRELLRALRRMEDRGEVRGGRFVSGFVGEQFALPAAVEALRAVRRKRPATPEFVRVAATDPLNLVGVIAPGPRVPALLDNAVLYCDGVPVASLEGGEKVERRPPPEGWSVGPDLTLRRADAAPTERRRRSA